MKKISIILCSILLLSILAGVSNPASADNLATINSATIVQTSATNGQQIEINIDASDVDGISYIQFSLYGPEIIPGNGPFYIASVPMSYNTTIAMYQGFYTIGQYNPVNMTIGQIYIEDNVSNYYYFYNSYLYSDTSSFTSGFISVLNTTPDYTPPTLNYIVSNATSINAGMVVQFTANITDDISGVSYVHVAIYSSLPNDLYYYNEWIKDIYLYKDLAGNFSGVWRTYDYTLNGSYTVGYMDIYDNLNNYVMYQNDPYSQHPLTFKNFDIINQNYQLPISNVHFDYLTVDYLSSQTFYFKINNFGSGYDYGYFYFYNLDPNNPNHSEYYGYVYVSSTDYNSTTDYYEVNLSNLVQEGTAITNGTIYISHFSLYQNNGDYYANYDYQASSPTFTVTGQLNQPFDVSIVPSSSSSYLGQNTTLGVKVVSNEYLGGSGNVSLFITGPESYNGTSTQLDFYSYGELMVNKQIHFNATGTYVIIAEFTTGNKTYSSTSSWLVKEPPVPELQVSISPESGSVGVNQQMSFTLNVTSTFLVNKTGIQVYILAAGPQILDQSFSIDVNALDSFIGTFDITFLEPGTYYLNATVNDGNNYWWSLTSTWTVVASPSTTTSSSSTVTRSNSDQTTGNNTATPQISLPGFGIYVTLIGFSFMVVTTYRSRKL